ncbi:hypothetical protein N8I77_005882 [Diaporthe amygdali]|uniref:Ecp2 effector protein-like domain-containing protein n=1 Tax=Phomopsis amygdali TaxID=1214568 RepID=A0AAD9SGX7_PHOAM|nr:hypothetical protein N8I77_005882 [Diaporthe amygdali]
MLSIILLLLGVLTDISLASDPHYQTPGTTVNITSIARSKSCNISDFDVVGGGQIQVADCFAITDGLNGTFSIEMSDWRDSTHLPDQYYKLITHGSCEIAVKRIDNRKGTTWVGRYDMDSIINQSVELAKVGDGDRVETVEGQMSCHSKGPEKALIAWSLRQPSNGKLRNLLGGENGSSKTAT